jgi:imidazolonepropionase-like amidohydrolase
MNKFSPPMNSTQTLTTTMRTCFSPASVGNNSTPVVPLRAAPLLSFLCLLLAHFATPVLAQTHSILLRELTIHTVSGETLSPGQILFRDGKILEVNQAIEPGEAEVIDLPGGHLYPGLIAPTTSLGLLEITAVRATRDTTESGQFIPDVQSWIAFNPDSELLHVARANGITHVLATPEGGAVSGQSGLMVLEGWTTEQMTVAAPVALHISWPDMRLNISTEPGSSSGRKSLQDQAEDRRKKLQELDLFFQEAAAYARARDHSQSFRLIPAWEAMVPFVKGDKPLVIHANELRQIKAALEWSQKQGYKMILAGGRDAWKTAALLAEHQIPVIYEHTFSLPPQAHDPYDIHFKAPAILHEAGVKVLFSEGLGGRGATSLRNLPYAAAQAVAFGFPAHEALKSLTLHSAELFGVGDKLGSIEPGKEATFFICNGDLLDLRSKVARMWISGAEVSLENRQTRLYQRYQKRPAPVQ